MAIDMEIISKEMIKPSSPTPDHLRTFKFSLLDQIAPPIHVPLIFFYNHHQLTLKNLTHHQISQLLKQSLSQILTVFYPLGGRIQENWCIDCDDSGAEYTEARVHTQLSQITQEPKMEQLKKLHPVGEDGEKVVLKVQTCFFDCGGVSVAICSSHKITDGTSLVAFANAWAATSYCTGGNKISPPIFDLAMSFPPRDLSCSGSTQRLGMIQDKISTKRLIFDKEEIMKLKDDCDGGTNPTRVETVSAYIWRRFMNLSKAKAKDSKKTTSFVAVHAVNLRSRKNPPFSQHVFGNCWRPTIASSEPEANQGDLVAKLRAAIMRIDNEFIETVENGEYLHLLSKSINLFINGGMEFCNFSSWCRFPVYEVDFGWGKPIWACTTTLPFKNLVILMSTPCGEGIEAWVNVVEEDLEMF